MKSLDFMLQDGHILYAQFQANLVVFCIIN